MKEYIFIVISIISNVLLIGYIIMMIVNIRTYFWDKADGKITRSEVEVTEDPDGDTYAPLIEYEYTINGELFNSSYVAFGTYGSGNRSNTDRIIKKFPKGKFVNVFYNPDKHEKSILQPGFRFHQLFLVIIIAFSIYVWVPFGWYAWVWLINL